jgi:hypothetical protein
MTKKEQRHFWIVNRNKTNRIIKTYQKRFYVALQADARDFLAAYQQGNGQSFINNFLVSPRITAILQQLIEIVGSKYARMTYNGLRNEKALSDWFYEIMAYLGQNFYDKGVFQIVKTSRAIFTDALNLGVQEGWGYREMARYVREKVSGINKYRSEMIARTEVARAIHSGTYVGADKSPYEKQKVWISAIDKRTRRNPKLNPEKADHVRLHGQTVDFNQTFIDPSNGVQMLHPHDPESPASEIINCRCTYAVTNKRDSEGRLIRKQPSGRVYVQMPSTFNRQIITV